MSKSGKKDFICLIDYTSDELKELVDLGIEMKKSPEEYRDVLKGRTLGMIFSKNSTRTRISFQTGIFQLGGQGLFFGANDLQLSRGETTSDTASVLSRYLDGVMIRTYSHDDLLEFAKHSTIPVINGLTDFNHPCQVMADMMTIKQKFGETKGLKLVYLGDGNNMTVSLMYGCIKFGIDFVAIAPKDYTIRQEVIKTGEELARDCSLDFTDDIVEGMKGANIVYADTWTSMGQELEARQRLKDLSPYQVNDKVMSMASKDAVFMHCLPAHREEEVTSSVIDGPRSVIFDQAENRLHAQKAIMYNLMK